MKVLSVKGYWKIKEPRRDEDGQCYELVPKDRGWTFNGDFEKPTFTPSVKQTAMFGAERKPYCNHVVITAGRIQYCDDCTHELAGQTLDLLPFTEAEIAMDARD